MPNPQPNTTITCILVGHLALGAAPLATAGPEPMGPDEALAKRKAGNERFVGSKVTAGKPLAERRAETSWMSTARQHRICRRYLGMGPGCSS